MMTAGCKSRIILIIIVSLVTGFVTSVTLDAVFIVKYAESLFTQEAMRDTLWLEFDGKHDNESEGGNARRMNNIYSLKTVPGVESIGVQVSLYSLSAGERVFALSESLLSRMRIPLSSGEWDFSISEQGLLPAVVSYDLSGKYPVGTTMSAQVTGNGANDSRLINMVVIGSFSEFGGMPKFNIGQYVSYPNLMNILYWHNLRNTLVIPLDTLPWNNKPGGAIESVIAIHMTDEAARSNDEIVALQEALFEKGFGFSATGSTLVKRANEIEAYDIGRDRLMIYLFIALTVAGVVCFNIAFAYHKRRDLAVLRLLGVTKRRIALNWVLMISYSLILPMIAGLSLGQIILSNGRACFPHRLQIKPEAAAAAVAIILLATYALSHRFLSKDISKSMKEEQ